MLQSISFELSKSCEKQVSSFADFSYKPHNQWLKVGSARCRWTLPFLDSKSSFESATWCYRSEEFSKGYTLRLQLSYCSKHNEEVIVVLNVDCILYQLKKCVCINRRTKSRRQLHLIFPLNHQRFPYVTEGVGILLTLRTVTRGEGRAKFSPKTALRDLLMIPEINKMMVVYLFKTLVFSVEMENLSMFI